MLWSGCGLYEVEKKLLSSLGCPAISTMQHFSWAEWMDTDLMHRAVATSICAYQPNSSTFLQYIWSDWAPWSRRAPLKWNGAGILIHTQPRNGSSWAPSDVDAKLYFSSLDLATAFSPRNCYILAESWSLNGTRILEFYTRAVRFLSPLGWKIPISLLPAKRPRLLCFNTFLACLFFFLSNKVVGEPTE